MAAWTLVDSLFALPAHLALALGLLLGSWTDIKTREVPDWLNFSLVATGIGLALLASMFTHAFAPLLACVLGILAGIILGHFLFYTGQWGGGDAKMIIGIGAILGLSFSQGTPRLLLFLLNTILAGALYGALWAFVLALRHRKAVGQEFTKLRREPSVMRLRVAAIIITFAGLVASFFAPTITYTIILGVASFLAYLLFLLWLLIKAVERSCMVRTLPRDKLTEGDWVYQDVYVPLGASQRLIDHMKTQHAFDAEQAIDDDARLGLYRVLGLQRRFAHRSVALRRRLAFDEKSTLASLLKAYVRKARRAPLSTAERQMVERALAGSTAALLDADTLLVKKHHPSLLAFLKEHVHYDPKKRYLAGPGDLGLTRRQIKELGRYGVKSVVVKDGIPFVPSFLMAYAATFLIGDWLALLF